MNYSMTDPNKHIGSVFVWEEQKVNEIMRDIVCIVQLMILNVL